ncbi:MAG: sigma-70 family RNA polymerase sigma factor [Pseudomonadota bacterium]
MNEHLQHYRQGPEGLVVRLAMRGDRDAFAELVRRRQSWVRNLMRRLCRHEADADDLSQRVFLKAWRNIKSIQQPEKFQGWLKRLAVNTWIDEQRKQQRRWSETLDEASVAAATSDASVQMDLDKALAELPPAVRACVVLSYHVRLSHRDIAEATGLPLGTVKSHTQRGAARLRELMIGYGEDQ